jgi:MFS family permease
VKSLLHLTSLLRAFDKKLTYISAGIGYVAAPFLGPTLGPIACGFLAETSGWKWVLGLITALLGLCWLAGLFLVPETYAPVLLRKRAEFLSRHTGMVHQSKLDAGKPPKTPRAAFKEALVRPWVLLAKEPIVLMFAIYMAISTWPRAHSWPPRESTTNWKKKKKSQSTARFILRSLHSPSYSMGTEAGVKACLVSPSWPSRQARCAE